MINQFLQANFGITGGLWANIMASVLLGGTGFLWGRAFEKRAIKRHTDMKAHISSEHLKSRQHLEEHVRNTK